MIPGVTIQMGGQDWQVPPLTLGQLRRLESKIKAMSNVDAGPIGISGETIETMAEVVAAALGRNYPDMTTERCLELLDLGNARAVLEAVLSGSGLKPGEARAVGNGATYTAYSPPPADTVTQ